MAYEIIPNITSGCICVYIYSFSSPAYTLKHQVFLSFEHPLKPKMDPKNDFCSPPQWKASSPGGIDLLTLGLPNLALLEKSDLKKKGFSGEDTRVPWG